MRHVNHMVAGASSCLSHMFLCGGTDIININNLVKPHNIHSQKDVISIMVRFSNCLYFFLFINLNTTLHSSVLTILF
jgi:hypothetical protein